MVTCLKQVGLFANAAGVHIVLSALKAQPACTRCARKDAYKEVQAMLPLKSFAVVHAENSGMR